MDAPEVSNGNTLYLPVNVAGRYFILATVTLADG